MCAVYIHSGSYLECLGMDEEELKMLLALGAALVAMALIVGML